MVLPLLKMNLLTLLFLLASIRPLGQVDEKLSRQILGEGAIDSTFIFSEWTQRTEVHLTYLGPAAEYGRFNKVMFYHSKVIRMIQV